MVEESGANDARGSTSIRKADAFLVEADACITSQPGEERTPGGNFVSQNLKCSSTFVK